MLTIKQNSLFVKILAFLFILSLFFPIRHVFLTKEAYINGAYSDFTSFSLYLSDILLFLLFVFYLIPRGKAFFHVEKAIKLLVLWLFIALITNFSKISLYWSFRAIELLVAYGTFRLIFQETLLKQSFLKLFAWLCGIESLIALIQFTRQSPMGLFRIGESHIGPEVLGIAKIVSSGTAFVRGYGTFPHPNLLSAFLVTGILFNIYLILSSNSLRSRIIYSCLLFLNILGLTVTFSRGAYLALGIGLIVYVVLLLWRHPDPGLEPGEGSQLKGFFGRLGSLRMTPIVVLASIIISFVLFKPFLLSRATFSDGFTLNRNFYDSVGIKMIEKNPIFGLGAGESVVMMGKYSPRVLEYWEKQPPHNYFIIAAAELGIPAMLILIWIFLSHLWELIKKMKAQKDSQLVTCYSLLITILTCFLLLMQFDHYFYTLQQTQLLLWVTLALIASQTKNPQEGENIKS